MAERCYLLTGASGFLGRELLALIARREPAARIYAPLRAAPGELERRAASLGWRHVAPRVVPVAGDLARLRAGLSPRDVERIGAEVTHVVHAGATVRFDEPLARARAVNVFGTRQLLELAQRMRRLERFVHVSTTFVCGDLPGTLLEGPAPAGRFRNAYERTKHEAEEVARRAMATLPLTIVRPSIVGPRIPAPGDRASASGTTGARFLLLLRLYAERGWRWVPGVPSSIVDLVPVDLVAQAILGIAHRPLGDGRWHHVAAGPRAATLRELGEVASRALHLPPLSFVPPRLLRGALKVLVWGRARAALDRAAPYVPYLRVRTRVDVTDARRVLGELGIELPRASDYFAALLGALPPPEVRARPADDPALAVDPALAARPPERFSAGPAGGTLPRRAAGRRS